MDTNKKSVSDYYHITATVSSPQPRPVELWPKAHVSDPSSPPISYSAPSTPCRHSSASFSQFRLPTQPMHTHSRYGSGTPAPFHPPTPVQPSPRGPDKLLAVGDVIIDLPSHPLPIEVTQLPCPSVANTSHCPYSNFEIPKHSFQAPFLCSTPLGITCDNHDRSVKSHLVNAGPGLQSTD